MKSNFDAGYDRWSLAIRPSVFAAVAILLLGGCVALSDSKIPGMGGKVIIVDAPPVSTILTALKCQLARAFKDIEDLKKNNSDHPLVKEHEELEIKNLGITGGTGTLTTSEKVIHANTGAVSAVIPFTGYAGSTLGPDLGAEITGTATEKTITEFKFEYDSSTEICDVEILKNVDEGTFLKDRIVASVEARLNLAHQDKETKKWSVLGPKILNTKLQIDTTFVVAVGVDGGVTSTILLGNPRLKSIGPGVTADYNKTDTNTLSVQLTLGTSEKLDSAGTPQDPRRIIYCDVTNIKQLCVEEPYDEDRYKVLIDALDDPLPYGISAEGLAAAKRREFQPFAEPRPPTEPPPEKKLRERYIGPAPTPRGY